MSDVPKEHYYKLLREIKERVKKYAETGDPVFMVKHKEFDIGPHRLKNGRCLYCGTVKMDDSYDAITCKWCAINGVKDPKKKDEWYLHPIPKEQWEERQKKKAEGLKMMNGPEFYEALAQGQTRKQAERMTTTPAEIMNFQEEESPI